MRGLCEGQTSVGAGGVNDRIRNLGDSSLGPTADEAFDLVQLTTRLPIPKRGLGCHENVHKMDFFHKVKS